jgi:glycosyltransferase 2 family protein
MMAMLRGRRGQVVALSLLLWFIHLLQIYMFTIALAMRIPFAVSASLSAIALMAGQLPFAFGGLGARDVAIVLLLKNSARPEPAAALGPLMATRNFLPPLTALPIVRPYAAAVAREMWLGPRTEED